MQQFPSITDHEFQNGCQAFYQRALNASKVNLSLHVGFHAGILSLKKEHVIIPYPVSKDEPTETIEEENDDVFEDEDHEAIDRACSFSESETIYIEYSIVRSPAYQVPVLWFTLNRVPAGITTGIDAVYQYLVPEATRSGLRQVGIMGAISIAVGIRRLC